LNVNSITVGSCTVDSETSTVCVLARGQRRVESPGRPLGSTVVARPRFSLLLKTKKKILFFFFCVLFFFDILVIFDCFLIFVLFGWSYVDYGFYLVLF